MGLLTETADYDEPGSWGRASEGWPEIFGDHAYDLYIFANKTRAVPYGSYVLMSHRGSYGAKVSMLRVHKQHRDGLLEAFESAGRPGAATWR